MFFEHLTGRCKERAPAHPFPTIALCTPPQLIADPQTQHPSAFLRGCGHKQSRLMVLTSRITTGELQISIPDPLVGRKSPLSAKPWSCPACSSVPLTACCPNIALGLTWQITDLPQQIFLTQLQNSPSLGHLIAVITFLPNSRSVRGTLVNNTLKQYLAAPMAFYRGSMGTVIPF